MNAEVVRAKPNRLVLRYLVSGNTKALRLPPAGAPKRADELWRHTCFEAFVRATTGNAYTEFNFAPSRQWAAYGFDAYRSGMRAASVVDTPQIEFNANDECYELFVELNLPDLPELPDDVAWDIGLSAVIEEVNGAKSYWALSHPPGKPDFHHSDCFAHQIPPALRA